MVAELSVSEQEAVISFKVKHKITPSFSPYHDPNDNIPVYVIPKSHLKKPPNQRRVLDVLPIGKRSDENNGFCDAFKEFEKPEDNKNPAKKTLVGKDPIITVNREENCIEFVSEGTVKCVYQANQLMKVEKVAHLMKDETCQTETDAEIGVQS